MKYGVASDRGKIRELNEDSYGILSGHVGIPETFIIADGMGGHNSGEVASKMAVDFVRGYILGNPEEFIDENRLCDSLRNTVEYANQEIYQKSLELQGTYGMGTTFIISVVFNHRLFIGHVGDSRVYLIRNEQITRITEDHSYIEELIKNGSLTREQANNHPKRNIITRALGCAQTVEIDTYICELQQDDIILLCTDGLNNMLDESEIISILKEAGDPGQACNQLVQRANEKGGEDNITVIVVKNE